MQKRINEKENEINEEIEESNTKLAHTVLHKINILVGYNSLGKKEYHGPCNPENKIHNYNFYLYGIKGDLDKKDNNMKFTDELYENINYGFIADEVEKVNKELVFYNKDNTLAGVEYNSIIAILTKAIQEINQKLVKNNIN